MLLESRRKAKESRGGSLLHLVQADAESLPFHGGDTFDLVMSLGDVLSYCNTDIALEESVRVLKTAGALLVGVDNRYALAAEALELEADVKKAEEFVKTGIGHYPEDWGGHLVKSFTPDELGQHLRQHGITIQDIIARPFLTRCLTRQKRRRLYSNPAKTSLLCELELMICKEPSILGASAVLFAIGTKAE
jgi:SAM-dependent methyltransferase